MRIALATCAKLPDWEVDDRPLHEALRRRNVEITRPVWDDPDVDWRSLDACVIRSTWDYQDKPDAYRDWVRRVADATMLLNPAPIVLWNTHKSYLRDLEARGVPVLPTVWCNRGSRVDVAGVADELGWSAGILKPAVGATAREILRFDRSPESLAAAQTHLDRLAAGEDMLLQPYLSSVEREGELSTIFIDGVFTHAVRKVPVPGDFRVQDDFGGSDEPVTPRAEDLALARQVVDAADGDPLYARVDFLRDDDGTLRLTELELVEPSLFFRHGPRVAERMADAIMGRLPGPLR